MAKHFTAWLLTAPQSLNSPYYEVEIVEDEYSDAMGWVRGDDVPVFKAQTSVERDSCDEKKAQEEAEESLRGAGWYTASAWEETDGAYTATARRC